MTRLVRFSNNAVSRLAANITSFATSISLTPGEGAKFPAISGSQYFMATLIKTDGTTEIIKVTARSTDTLTVARAAESVGGVTTAYAFTAGDRVEQRLTSGVLGTEIDRLDALANIYAVTKSANYTVLAADVAKLIKVDTTSGGISITLPLISSLVDSFEIKISKSSGDANTVTVSRSGSDTINGLLTYSLTAQYQCVWLVADLATNTWTAVTSASSFNRVIDVFTGSGTSGPFTLSGDPGTKNNTDVFVGGVYQQKSTYTLSGTALTLGGVVGSGVSVEVLWAQPLSMGVPSDGSVVTAKLGDGSVTTVKLADASVTLAKTTGVAASGANSDITSLSGVRTIQPISASVASNALTISASSLSLDFRSATLSSGAVTNVLGAPANLVVPSGATLGTVSAQQSRIVVLAINNAGTLELAVTNIAGGTDLTETGRISTTAITAGATSASVVYSTTARTNVAYRVVGYVESTQATAGTWATAPSTVQGYGGQALAAMSSIGYGQTWQSVTRTSGTTYYNTTGKPITVVVFSFGTTTLLMQVNGVSAWNQNSVGAGSVPCGSVLVPPGASYVVTCSSIAAWNELR
jgi:hypothetical protein